MCPGNSERSYVLNIFSFVCVFKICTRDLSTSMSVYHVHAWCLQQPEKSLDPLELESQIVRSCDVGGGTRPRFSGRAASALSHGGIYSSPASVLKRKCHETAWM
ncbi:mCG57818 [Mus musculus]|nr:mCG57818 [Mus musculus]